MTGILFFKYGICGQQIERHMPARNSEPSFRISRLGMEPPARQLRLWRKIATAVPAVDAQPRPHQHKWMPAHIHTGDAEFRGPHSVVRVSGLRVTA